MNENKRQELEEQYKQDFNTALNLYETNYPHTTLINFLKNGSIVEKQIATIKLQTINNQEEANIFINNLINCDGKIREAVSFKLKEFIKYNPEFYQNFYDIFLDAIVDINGNICRNVIESIKHLQKYPKFIEQFCPNLVNRTIEIAKLVKEFDIQDGKYKINKQNFKLYWYLETISEFYQYIELKEILKIINITKDALEYTIREKTAKILSKLEKNDDTIFLKELLKNDENYYVRKANMKY